VGQRVYVNRSGSGIGRVDLMNEDATSTIGNLADGVEVVIVAWKPRGATGTRYCVRSTADGLEGWLAAGNLRRTATAPPPTPLPPQVATPATPAPASQRGGGGNPKPRFGGR
jgi:hypothetical protein